MVQLSSIIPELIGAYYFRKHACEHTQLFQSCWTLCNLMNCNPPGSSVCGILQARILERFVMPSSRGFSLPGTEPASSALQADSYCWAAGEAPLWSIYFILLSRQTTELYLSSLAGCLGMIWTFLHSHPPHRNFPENKPLAHIAWQKMLARLHIIIKKANVSMSEYWPSHALLVSLHIFLPFLPQEL